MIFYQFYLENTNVILILDKTLIFVSKKMEEWDKYIDIFKSVYDFETNSNFEEALQTIKDAGAGHKMNLHYFFTKTNTLSPTFNTCAPFFSSKNGSFQIACPHTSNCPGARLRASSIHCPPL
jgi:hypothetical protein